MIYLQRANHAETCNCLVCQAEARLPWGYLAPWEPPWNIYRVYSEELILYYGGGMEH